MQQRRPQPGMTSNMAGVSVRGNLLAFDCEDINLADQKLGEAELLPLLHALSRGEFPRLKRLNLVRAALLSHYGRRSILRAWCRGKMT
jgi:hypothetical protein